MAAPSPIAYGVVGVYAARILKDLASSADVHGVPTGTTGLDTMPWGHINPLRAFSFASPPRPARIAGNVNRLTDLDRAILSRSADLILGLGRPAWGDRTRLTRRPCLAKGRRAEPAFVVFDPLERKRKQALAATASPERSWNRSSRRTLASWKRGSMRAHASLPRRASTLSRRWSSRRRRPRF